MGIEIFFQFIDRNAVEPVLAMSWKSFLRKYPWNHRELEEEVIVLMPDSETVSSVLAKRTLRWTMERAGPDYFFLSQVIYHVPYLRRRCTQVWAEDYAEVAAITATAVEAFLKGKIGERTLWAVYAICGSQNPKWSLRLSRSELFAVNVALGCGAVEMQIFPWQTPASLSDGYSCLQPADTRRFISFLTRAWKANWSIARLKDTERGNLGIDRRADPHFRDFELSRNFMDCIRRKRLDGLYTLHFFG